MLGTDHPEISSMSAHSLLTRTTLVGDDVINVIRNELP